ncbi:hypothetical protein RO3G_07601 [Rhizopus delemar RA 99-880]|uniref:Uncharacterized protein n=1 Tax=Rhizopus delemar (strain RA 99-880 / ATCC MYA-4621 / FGSC 9543 / NRRL 43880) TaxID=246409 RepID=I1C366_RHIO9|nr:hypothetical protein RO3G_07601 [Rhizopus delemar RA 99-880]|eukprot:EIE82896.1 hypothetical protein RO3G_07601 [Rhizopus delemar RA 99-880]
MGHLIQRNKDQLYVITPKTTIMTVSQENRIVYIVDLSSSLATVGDTQSDILLSEVYRTVISFSRLSELPSWQIILKFMTFQQDTAQFRKEIKRTRNNMGYNLDVGSKTDPSVADVLDATSFTSKHRHSLSINKNQKNQADENREDTSNQNMSESQTDTDQSSKDTSRQSSKKEVWGIGKSGANLSRILHAGHFALKLLPKEGSARLILITDGSMKSNVHDSTFVRQFAEEDITCHIIQVGSSNGFIPGKNFGFVPDTEILKFLARATNGTFMYSERCSPVTSISLTAPDKERNQTQSDFAAIQSTANFVDINQSKNIPNPNIYHHRFLFRETTFAKTHNEVRLASDSDPRVHMNRRETSRDIDSERRKTYSNFPWDPYAKAPEEEWRLLKYGEYMLPSEFSHIIAARAREGFVVQSVSFDDGTGARQVDPGIHDLEAKNLLTMRKERVQIVMIMHWQPNVVIEYRIRATWLPLVIGSSNTYNNETLLMSSGIFPRAKAPRAEIYVRTDVSFAHMLQNWDVFKRRAQMMGVVTGYIYFGETYAAPVYSKIEKLKKYLIDIYEGDEALKSTIGFPGKFWMNISTSESTLHSLPSSLWPEGQNFNETTGRYHIAQQQELSIKSFKIFWDRLNTAETRARTRCWYDSGCIDLLVGDVSPFMSPKLLSVYNQDFVNNVEGNIRIMIENVKSVMEDWADFVGEDGTFVKIIHKTLPNLFTSHDDITKETFAQFSKLPPSFCELRVRHEYGRLITLRLLFFNVECLARNKVKENLVHILKTSPLTALPCNMICQRSFSMLLMRDSKHFSDNSVSSPDIENQGENVKSLGNQPKNQNRSKSWYLPFATWLTSEHIVHDYLHHTTWSWQTDSHDDTYHKNNRMMPIHDLAFQFLCQTRLDQGYQLVSPRRDSTQFYQEITLPATNGKHVALCAIQYFVWKDSATGKITTELWIEPAGEFDIGQYDRVKKWTFEPDRKKISQLVTFDQVHAIGRSRGIGEFKEKIKTFQTTESDENDSNIFLLPQLFDVSSVLQSNKFVVASFRCPKFEITPRSQQNRLQLIVSHPDEYEKTNEEGVTSNINTAANTPNIKNKSLTRTQRYLRRSVNHSPADFAINLSLSSEEQSLFVIRPDSLLSSNVRNIIGLNVTLQSYAILHYFVERSLEYISSGEINMSHHNLGTSFWNELRNAICKLSKDQKVTSTSLVTDLRKMRCFVKVFDPRSFVVTLSPNLDSIVNSLLKLQKDNANDNSLFASDYNKKIDVFMFECIRQKPMKPTKDVVSSRTSNHFLTENIIDDTDRVNIKPIEFLIHESDGLGEMLRPELYEGHFSGCQTNAQVSERTLRVAQDIVKHYSKSFFNSFYASLVRGFTASDDDLSKVLEVCHESNMELDLTEFMNMMAMQKEEYISLSRDVQVAESQGKFNAIFNQYFSLVHTKSGKQTNLFYYKPSFSRYNVANMQLDDASENSKISFIINLATHSRSPLLVKLLCAYKNVPDNKNPKAKRTPETVVPVNTLPTLYLDSINVKEKKNSEKSKSSNDHPFVLKDKQVSLQLVFLNMPKTELENSDLNIHNNVPSETVEYVDYIRYLMK